MRAWTEDTESGSCLFRMLSQLSRSRYTPVGALMDDNVQSIDPKSIMFTVPTVSNELPPLDPVETQPRNDEPQMHEDDWCQVEFFHKGYVQELERMLREYKTFEASNRQMITIEGEQCPIWRNAYVREVVRQPLLTGNEPAGQIARIVGGQIGPAPVLYMTSSWSGRVQKGFSVGVGRNVYLYGYVMNDDVPVIGASLGPDPDDQALVRAFTRLNAALGLVLVDWKQQFILLDTSPNGKIKVWQP